MNILGVDRQDKIDYLVLQEFSNIVQVKCSSPEVQLTITKSKFQYKIVKFPTSFAITKDFSNPKLFRLYITFFLSSAPA